MKNSLLIFGTMLIIAAAFSSCKRNIFYVNNVDFSSESWSKDSTLIFEVEILDTNEVYNVFFNTRITGQYEYNNMFLFIDTDIPHIGQVRDTLECILAKADGQWLGKGFGNIWSNKIAFRHHVRFPYSGIYRFKIEQAMRTDNLPYVLDAGLSIEKAK